MTEQVARFRRFRDGMSEEIIVTHPVWIMAEAKDREQFAEGLEYIICNQIYSK